MIRLMIGWALCLMGGRIIRYAFGCDAREPLLAALGIALILAAAMTTLKRSA